MRSQRGEKLSVPYTFSFTTAPFQVTYISPYDGAIGIDRYLYNVQVSFNAQIDTGSVRTAFIMKDSAGTTLTGTFNLYGSYFYFYPSNLPLTANATYTVTISTGLRSKSGAYLKYPYTFSFTTGN